MGNASNEKPYKDGPGNPPIPLKSEVVCMAKVFNSENTCLTIKREEPKATLQLLLDTTYVKDGPRVKPPCCSGVAVYCATLARI